MGRWRHVHDLRQRDCRPAAAVVVATDARAAVAVLHAAAAAAGVLPRPPCCSSLHGGLAHRSTRARTRGTALHAVQRQHDAAVVNGTCLGRSVAAASAHATVTAICGTAVGFSGDSTATLLHTPRAPPQRQDARSDGDDCADSDAGARKHDARRERC